MNGDADVANPPLPTRQASVVAAFVIMFAAATTAVGLRIYTRMKLLYGLKTEDWFVLVAWVFSLGVTFGFIRQTTLALGRHAWTLSPEVIRASGKEEWYSFLFYVVSLSATKTSILLLYRRILPLGPSRTANHVLLAIVTACNAIAIVLRFVTCVPLRAAWDERVEGLCLSEAVHLGSSLLNVVTEFMIFGVLVPWVWGLRMEWRRKAGLVVVFALGFVVCLVSMIRVISLSRLDFADATWNLATIAYWGSVEVNLPIICACLTTIRPLLNRLLPGLLGPSTSQCEVTSVAAVPSERRDAAGWSGVHEEGAGCLEGGAVSTSEGESFVFMLHDTEASLSRSRVEPPAKAYGGV